MDSNRIIQNIELRNVLLADLIEKYIWEFKFGTNEFYVSPYWNRFLGYGPEDVKESKNFWLSVIHPEDIQILKKKIQECKQRIVDIFSAEYRVRSKNGIYKWIFSEAKIHYDETENPVSMIGYNLNLSDLKEKEDTRSRKIVEMAPTGAIIYENNIITYINNAGARFLGASSKDELIGKDMTSIIHKDYWQIAEQRRASIKCGKIPEPIEMNLVRCDRRVICAELYTMPINFKGNIAGLSYIKDITEQKRILEEKQKLLENTLEYDRIKTEFFSNISHELRTPLNIVLSSIQLLNSVYRDKHIKPERFYSTYEKHVGAMQQNSYRLLKLINNLIDITQIDAGFIKTELRNQNIVDIIENISMSAVPYLESKGISLVFDTDIEEKIIAFDEEKMERIILNLLSNAAKFTDPGDAVHVIIKDEGESVNIIIKDTGHGIPEDKVNIIFDRFRQVDSLFTRRAEGSGIGLSLVKYLVEAHKGSICVNSTLGRGSEFIITLPAKIIDNNIESYKFKHEIRDNESKIELVNIEFSDIYK